MSADALVQRQIDAEILRKHAEASQTCIDAMLSSEARGCTLRLEAPSA